MSISFVLLCSLFLFILVSVLANHFCLVRMIVPIYRDHAIGTRLDSCVALSAFHIGNGMWPFFVTSTIASPQRQIEPCLRFLHVQIVNAPQLLIALVAHRIVATIVVPDGSFQNPLEACSALHLRSGLWMICDAITGFL